MKVLKFGGTSVGTVESLRNVKQIVESTSRPAIVVVSALGGVTDMLIATGRQAAAGNEEAYLATFAEIRRRHTDVIEGIVSPGFRNSVETKVASMLAELERIYLGVYYVADLSERVLARIVSYGERMSSVIVSGIIDGITLRDSMQFIRTVSSRGRNRLDTEATSRLVAEHLADASMPGALTLVQGFISTDASGEITNLGRGGSDYTAAILAAEFNATSLEIWTDVDGFLTSDPRKTTGTRIIDRMSFVEAMDLCNFGAKVVYPPTIYPVFHKSIPVCIKNTFNPEAPGTLIADREGSGGAVRGISSLAGLSLITLSFADAEGARRNGSRVLNAMARKGIDIFTVGRPDAGTFRAAGSDFCFTVGNGDVTTVVDELTLEFASELAESQASIAEPMGDLASVALVGEGLEAPRELASRTLACLSEAGVAPRALAVGNSQSNIVVVVDAACEKAALQSIHDMLFPGQH